MTDFEPINRAQLRRDALAEALRAALFWGLLGGFAVALTTVLLMMFLQAADMLARGF